MTMASKRAVVTGARSYIGGAAARSLAARGWDLRTLTNRASPLRPGGPEIPSSPLQFRDRDALVAALGDARVLVNTYWVRYPRHGVDFDLAVENSRILFEAAREAGVERIVHVSVSNPRTDSPLAYYAGKARVEAILREIGGSHGIVRPTLVVGVEDILVNNIAWALRRFPFFGMPGTGDYRVQPITLEETGEIVADVVESDGDLTVDAAGPEVLSFEALVRGVAAAIGRPARIVHLPPWLVLATVGVIGWCLGDVMLTDEEYLGLAAEALVSHEAARGKTAFSDWVRAHGAALGRRYESEWERHFRGHVPGP